MYYLLSLLSGVLISVMLVFNGSLTAQYGVNSSTVIIHIVGLILIAIIILLKKDLKIKKLPFYFFLGGLVGVGPTAFTNIAFGRISVSAILALELLGQSITGIIFDNFGLLGIKKRKFRKRSLLGIGLILIGIISMITDFDLMAVTVSFSSGILLVIAQILNAKLSEETSVCTSTFFNYIVGLAAAIPICLLLGRNEPMFTNFSFSPEILIYLGGVLGVCIVLISNITILKISVFYMTLFIFIGQIFSGIIIDAILTQSFSMPNLIGGIFTSAGLILNLVLDKKLQ
ncbi:MAG: DMT family transporter [Candidatus Metalachnospira sp.]|nr:DMT family transporter [Candidatus Metalachnospira sp.]